MPSAVYLQTDTSLDLSALDAVTVYWFGRISSGGEGLIWHHGFNSANGIGLFVEAGEMNEDQLRVKMLNTLSDPNEWIYDLAFNSLHDVHICVATVIDLTQPSGNQITPYINGSAANWSQSENFTIDSFGDFQLVLGDNGVVGASPTRCQAFAVFPVAHTQAQVQAVSDDWFEKSGVNV